MMTMEPPPPQSSKYDLLKPWSLVRRKVEELVGHKDDHEEAITIPSGVHVLHLLHHFNAIKAITLVQGNTSDTIITQQSIGMTHELTVWTIPRGNNYDLQTIKYEVVPEMRTIYFLKKYRVLVAYCSDMTLRILSDVTHGCIELSTTECQYSVFSICYMAQTDELLTGGMGVLLRWSMKNFRDGMKCVGTFGNLILDPEEIVMDLKCEENVKKLFVQTDRNIYVMCTLKGDILDHMPNHHMGQLTCTAYHAARDYFITASRDGTIKVWHSQLYSEMHQFLGHTEEVTSLLVHQREPVLVSSSLDGTLRVWRLDTFEPQQRIDLNGPVLGFRFLGVWELVYWTQNDVHHCRLNLFHQLFCSVQSCVLRLSRWNSTAGGSRILASVEDGSIRLLCPVTGTAITIVYPLMSDKVLSLVLYNPQRDELYTYLNGAVLVYDCTTNPCTPLYKLCTTSKYESPVISIALCSLKTKPYLETGSTLSLRSSRCSKASHWNSASRLPDIRVTSTTSAKNSCKDQEKAKTSMKEVGVDRKSSQLLQVGDDKPRSISGTELSSQDSGSTHSLDSGVSCETSSSGCSYNAGGSSETLLFAGHEDGTITLIHAATMTMTTEHKAHQGAVVLLSTSIPLSPPSTPGDTASRLTPDTAGPRLASTECLVSCGSDRRLVVWDVTHRHRDVGLTGVAKVKLPYLPKIAVMMGTTICVIFHNSGLVQFYRLFGDAFTTRCTRVQTQYHRTEEDHLLQTQDVAACAKIRTFVTSSLDCTLKIWGYHGDLLRELTFVDPLYGVCYANTRGDILVGFKNHIHSVAVEDYLPTDLLEKLLECDFEDEIREDHISFSNKRYYRAPEKSYPYSLDQRREVLSREAALNKTRVPVRTPSRERATRRLQAVYDKYLKKVDNEADKNVTRRLISRWVGLKKLYFQTQPASGRHLDNISETTDSVPSTEEDYEVPGATSDYYSASDYSTTDYSESDYYGETTLSDDDEDDINIMGPQRRKSSVKLGKAKSSSSIGRGKKASRRRLVEVVDEVAGALGEAGQLDSAASVERLEAEQRREEERRREEEARRRKYPVAPDGYVPNSVIRGMLTIYKPPPPPKPESPWKLKPCPAKPSETQETLCTTTTETSYFSENDVTMYLSDTSSVSGPHEYSDLDETEEEDDDEPQSSSDKEEDKTSPEPMTSHESTHITGLNSPVKEKKVTTVKSGGYTRDSDSKMSPRRHGPMSKQTTFTSTISEEAEEDGGPAEPIPLLQKIASEAWFPRSVSPTLAGVVSAFCAILSNVNNDTHRTICDYIVQIHQELSYPAPQETKILDKLLAQLTDPREIVRENAVRTLGMMGNRAKNVIVGILPLLTDHADDVRTEAQIALKRLTGVDTKEELHTLLEEMGIVHNYSSKDDEEAVLAELTQTLTQGTAAAVEQLPTENVEPGGLVESWLEGADGAETDNSGLYSEEGSVDGSGYAGSLKNNTARSKGVKGRRQSKAHTRGGPRSDRRQSQLPGGSTGQDSSNRDTLCPPGVDSHDEAVSLHSVVSSVPELSHTAKYDKNGLYPNNPALYKVYNHRNSDQGRTTGHQNSTEATTEGGTQNSRVVIPSDATDNDVNESTKAQSDVRTARTDSTKTTHNDDKSLLLNSVTEEDSGLGHTVLSDDMSNLSRDKTAVVSSLQFRARSGLSPVLSTNLYDQQSVTDDDNWREFFHRPSAQERRRQLEQQSGQLVLDPAGRAGVRAPGGSGGHRDVSLPPIRYLAEDTELVAGDPGVRLLHSVTVKPQSSESYGDDKRHMIDAVPGKLGVTTTTEEFGYSKFGILDLHWTTGIPFSASMCRRFVNQRNSHNGPETGHNGPHHHARLGPESGKVTTSTKASDKLFPSLTNEDSGYQWVRPLPPAPDRESRLGDAATKQDHKHYCDYYRLLKKRMHQHISLPVLTARSPPECPKVKVTNTHNALPALKHQPLTSRNSGISKMADSTPSTLLPFISWRTVISCDM